MELMIIKINIHGLLIHGHGMEDIMYKYDKKLPYPIDIKKKDLNPYQKLMWI